MGLRTAARPRVEDQQREPVEIHEAYLDPEEVTYALASMPGRTPETWTGEERKFWAATVVPASQQHATLASQLAARCGTRSVEERAVAATHILLTLTLGSPSTPSHQVRPTILHSAYDLLEAALPSRVRRRLPIRVVRTRGVAAPLQRRLLATALVAAGVVAAVAEVRLLEALLG